MRRELTHLWELFEPVVNGMGYDLIEIEQAFPEEEERIAELEAARQQGERARIGRAQTLSARALL